MSEQKAKVKGYYIVIPAAVRLSPVSSTAKLLYGEISALSNEYGYAFPTNEYFEITLGYGTRAIQKCLLELETIGFIKVDVVKNIKGTSRRIYIIGGTHPVAYGGTHYSAHGGTHQDAHGCALECAHNNTTINTPIGNNNLVSFSSPNVEEKRNVSQGEMFPEGEKMPANEPEKKKKSPAPKKEKESDGIHARMIDSYFMWVIPILGGNKPFFGPAEGKALKAFITHLKTSVNAKREKGGLPLLEGKELADEVITGWEAVLNSRHKWDNFRQGQLKINQIISNWTNILNDIFNRNKQTGERAGRVDTRTAEERGADISSAVESFLAGK